MRRIILFLVLAQISLVNYGQIIADHTVVDKYDDIPQYYVNEVKKMWVTIPGESHSQACRTELVNLETAYPAYAVSVVESGTPEPYTTSNLRVSRATWGDYDNATGWIYSYGEEDWFTSTLAKTRTKAGITYCNTHSLTISAMGFGWCWDEGVMNMTNYLSATQEYIDYCTSNGYSTKVFFTTGTVDDYEGTQMGYDKSILYNVIRDYVALNPTRILFDYADILCFDNDGTPTTSTWNGHTFPYITYNNLNPESGDYHISPAGALRLAKAMWWMLARIAGWDGMTTDIKKNESLKPTSVVVYNDLDEIRVHTSEKYISGQLSLYNIQGNLVEKMNISSELCVFHTSSIPSGVYFISVKNANLSESRKIVVLK
jgi:hypothetical protein